MFSPKIKKDILLNNWIIQPNALTYVLVTETWLTECILSFTSPIWIKSTVLEHVFFFFPNAFSAERK